MNKIHRTGCLEPFPSCAPAEGGAYVVAASSARNLVRVDDPEQSFAETHFGVARLAAGKTSRYDLHHVVDDTNEPRPTEEVRLEIFDPAKGKVIETRPFTGPSQEISGERYDGMLVGVSIETEARSTVSARLTVTTRDTEAKAANASGSHQDLVADLHAPLRQWPLLPPGQVPDLASSPVLEAELRGRVGGTPRKA